MIEFTTVNSYSHKMLVFSKKIPLFLEILLAPAIILEANSKEEIYISSVESNSTLHLRLSVEKKRKQIMHMCESLLETH